VEVDVPHRKFNVFVGLDDREAGTRHLPLVPKLAQQPADKRRFSCGKGPGQGDDVTRFQRSGQLPPESQRCCFILQLHCGARGMVMVMLVPFPTADSNWTEPPCASTNWRVSGSL